MAQTGIGKFTYNVARRTQKGGETIGKKVTNSASDEYTVVIADGKHPNEVTISGLPNLGDEWDLHADWFCTKISWTNSFPEEYWKATVEYKPSNVTNQPPPSEEDPEPVNGGSYTSVEITTSSWNIDLENDALTGDPLVNMAGDRFQDAITTQVFSPTIVIKSQQPRMPITQFTMSGTINDDTITICGITIPPYCGLLTINCSGTSREEDPWDVTYTIKTNLNTFLPPGHILSYTGGSPTIDEITISQDEANTRHLGFCGCVLNAGYRYWYEDPDTHEYELVRFIDTADYYSASEGAWKKKEIAAVDPQLLNAEGEKPSDDDDDGDGVPKVWWLWFRRYKAIDWSTLGLPEHPFGAQPPEPEPEPEPDPPTPNDNQGE